MCSSCIVTHFPLQYSQDYQQYYQNQGGVLDSDTATISGSTSSVWEMLFVRIILQQWYFTLAFRLLYCVKGDLAHFALRMSE